MRKEKNRAKSQYEKAVERVNFLRNKHLTAYQSGASQSIMSQLENMISEAEIEMQDALSYERYEQEKKKEEDGDSDDGGKFIA